MSDFQAISHGDAAMSDTIYIDGVKRRATHIGAVFFVDADCLPGRRCAQHTLTSAAVVCLKNGGSVYTTGHWYSMRPSRKILPAVIQQSKVTP